MREEHNLGAEHHSNRRTWWPLLGISQDLSLDLGLLLIRCMLGVVMVFHGGQKLFGWWNGPGLAGFASFLDTIQVPYPAYGAVLAGSAEFFGGLALISGLGFRWAIVPIVATMATAITFVHPSQFSVQDGGMEYALTLGVAASGLLLTGPGRLALRALPRLPWSATERPVINLTSEPLLDRSFSR